MQVGSYPDGKSPYGVMDLAGNVWEWVADWYNVNYYGDAPTRNPKGPSEGRTRVGRGGAYDVGQSTVRASYRQDAVPDFRSATTGFRCAQ